MMTQNSPFGGAIHAVRRCLHDMIEVMDAFNKLERQHTLESASNTSPAHHEILSRLDDVENAIHREGSATRHEVERLRKGGKATKRWSVDEQRGAARIWNENKRSPFVRQQMNHEGRIQKPDVFVHYKKELAKLRVETPEEFALILEQDRKRNRRKSA